MVYVYLHIVMYMQSFNLEFLQNTKCPFEDGFSKYEAQVHMQFPLYCKYTVN